MRRAFVLAARAVPAITPALGFCSSAQAGEGSWSVEFARRLAGGRSDSPLGRSAAYMLGSAFSKSFANFEERRLRPADRPLAIEHLEAVKDALPSFYFTAKAHLLLDLDYRRLGREDQAARVRADLERALAERHPDLRPWLPVIRAEVARSFERRADG